MAQTLSPDAVLRASNGVMACELGEGLALLHHDSGTFFMLDEVGAFIWNMLERPATTDQITAALDGAFEVSPDDAGRDVAVFVHQMIEASLLCADRARP